MTSAVSSRTVARVPVVIRPMQSADLDAADHVMRVAFGTFIGLAEPAAFLGDASYVHSRFRARPASAFVATVDDVVVGSNFASNWGSVGFLGPLTVRPDLWDAGIGKRLMEPAMSCFQQWHTRHVGLFTFPHSTKHIALYQKFGFYPRFLTAIMSRTLTDAKRTLAYEVLSSRTPEQRRALIAAGTELTDAIYDGLDVSSEIASTLDHAFGDVVAVHDGKRLVALAVCHYGAGSEAGSNVCYIKFAAVAASANAARHYGALLDACEAMALERGLEQLRAGVNTAHHEAYRQLLSRGFRIDVTGISMTRPNTVGYNRADVFVLDDWR